MTERLACFAVTLAVISLLASDAAAAPPVVSNVSASQRTDGSKKVDIYYNLADRDSATLTVSVKVSGDGGATWSVQVSQLSGDVGSNVSRGTGRHVVWESCGTDLPGAYGTDYRVSLTATDGPTPGEMVYIPAGSFLMGNNGGEPYSYDRELPQHSVYLSGYWIGKYEVTRGEFRRFIEAGGYSSPAFWSSEGWNWKVSNSRTEPEYWAAAQDWYGPFTQTDSHPVVGVTYYEAEAYCNWSGGHLPTEAQWEKAARWDGTPRVYPWGNVWDPEKCNNWYDHNPAGGGYQRWQTAPVGSYLSGASPYGLQDMLGNVWEWCRDWGASYPGSTSPYDYTGSDRVLRGGSWLNSGHGSYFDRCAFRRNDNPGGIWVINYGFRIAR